MVPPRVSPLPSRPGTPLFLEVLSLKNRYPEIRRIIRKDLQIVLRSLTATAVTLLKPAVTWGMRVVPPRVSLLPSRPRTPLFLEVLSLKPGYPEIRRIIRKDLQIPLRSLTAPAVTLLKPAVTRGMGVVPPRVSPLPGRPRTPLFLEVLSLKPGYPEIVRIIRKGLQILLCSLTATAVTLLKPAVTRGMRVVPPRVSLLPSRPGTPLFLELLSLKPGYPEIVRIIRKDLQNVLRSLTAPAVTLLKPAVTWGMGVVPPRVSPLPGRPRTPLFLEVLSLRPGTIIRKYLQILLCSSTATAVTLRSTLMITSPSRWQRTDPVMSAGGGRRRR